MNGDGRFDPNPNNGERITMTGDSTNYSSGVTYQVQGIIPIYDGIQDLHYVFRFADRYWYPPETGGVVPDNNEGISYRHLVLNDVLGNSFFLPGDLNSDGIVDIMDLFLVASDYGKTNDFDPRADAYEDGVIDVMDLFIVASNYGRSI